MAEERRQARRLSTGMLVLMAAVWLGLLTAGAVTWWHRTDPHRACIGHGPGDLKAMEDMASEWFPDANTIEGEVNCDAPATTLHADFAEGPEESVLLRRLPEDWTTEEDTSTGTSPDERWVVAIRRIDHSDDEGRPTTTTSAWFHLGPSGNYHR